MSRRTRGPVLQGLACLVAAIALPFEIAHTQATTQAEWWPELDIFWTDASGRDRIFGMASISQTADQTSRQRTLGLHFDYLSLPWGYLRVGYRQIESVPPGSYHESRGVIEGTAGFDIGWQLRAYSRSRLELRWISGDPSQRLRERLQIQRTIEASKALALAPYATDELYYDTQYHAISRNGYRFGVDFRYGRRYNTDLYYARQDNRFSSIRHVNALGLTVGLRYGNVGGRR